MPLDLSRPAIRRQLQRLFLTASDFDAFLIDHFPEVSRRLSSGMGRVERENLLLQLVDPAEIASAMNQIESAGRASQRMYVTDPLYTHPKDAQLMLEIEGELRRSRLYTHPKDAQPMASQQTKTSELTATPPKEAPPLVFLEYVEADKRLVEDLLIHLSLLTRRQQLQIFHRGMVSPGVPVEQVLDRELSRANLIVAVVSPDLLGSERFDAFLKHARHRQREGARMIPLLGRPSLWDQTPLGLLTPLPHDGRALSERQDAAREQALANAAKTIADLAGRAPSVDSVGEGEPSTPDRVPPVTPPRPMIPLGQIFPRRAGQLPKYTLVEPEQIETIRKNLLQLGLGLIVEGPSGSGKTTAVKRALELLGPGKSGQPKPAACWIHGRDVADQQKLQAHLANGFLTGGHLIIDDFHRLPPALRQGIADLIKVLADSDRTDAKVTVIGINPVGTSLMQGGTDLSGRYAKVTMGRQKDLYIRQLIEQGEAAANVRFLHKDQLIEAAQGSFFIAQMLCYFTADKDGLSHSLDLPEPKIIAVDPDYALTQVQQQLDDRFRNALLDFASFTCPEEEGPRGVTLALLGLLHLSHREATRTNESLRGTSSLSAVESRYPVLASSCRWFGQSHLARRFVDKPALGDLFNYDRDSKVLSAEDPQLAFYLARLDWIAFIRDTGHDRAKVKWSQDDGLLFLYGTAATSSEQPSRPSVLIPKLTLPRSCFLHLSDLHFSSVRQVNTFIDLLEADLSQLQKQTPPLTGIVVSGDLTQKADRGEFQAAQEFLGEIRATYKLGPKQLVIVPGNHDGSWELSQTAYGPIATGSDEPKHPVDAEAYRRRFSAFADFYQEVSTQPYPLDFDRQATLHEFKDHKVLFLGLNSSWQCDHLKEHQGRASIHLEALSVALRAIRREPAYADWLKIAVFHHPVQSDGEDRIKNSGFLDRLAQDGFRLAMHGHLHAAQTQRHAYDVTVDGRKLQLVGAGTFGAPTREWRAGVPLQYQILCFDGARGQVISRCRDNPEAPWRADGRWVVGARVSDRYDIEL